MYGALLGIAGAGVGAVGANRTRRALKGANRNYNRDLRDYYAQEQEASRGFQRQYEGVNDRRLNRMGTMLDEYMAPAYGQQASDTATVDQALASVGGNQNPGAGMNGAAVGWGTGVAERTGEATGRQRMIAGDASMLQRIGEGQTRALTDQSLDDQRFGREVGNIQQMEQLRRAALARRLQGIQMRGQRRFDKAGRAGQDWTAMGGYLGMGGQLLDAWGAQASPTEDNPDTEDRGSRVLGYSFAR